MLKDTDWLELVDEALDPIPSATIYVHDALSIARAVACDIFGDDVTPELVIQVYDRVLSQIKVEESDKVRRISNHG